MINRFMEVSDGILEVSGFEQLNDEFYTYVSPLTDSVVLANNLDKVCDREYLKVTISEDRTIKNNDFYRFLKIKDRIRARFEYSEHYGYYIG